MMIVKSWHTEPIGVRCYFCTHYDVSKKLLGILQRFSEHSSTDLFICKEHAKELVLLLFPLLVDGLDER